jgi:3-methyladenine DNA glycosylase AlkD
MNTSTAVRRIVTHLKTHGSPERAAGIQRFFKEEARSHGWKTADLRRYARTLGDELRADPAALLDVAEALFQSVVLEEKGLGVLILQRSLRTFGPAEFRRFERWFRHVASWADHDALAMFLIGPMMTAEPSRSARALSWTRSTDRWHRRAAAVSLIDGVRHGLFTAEAATVTDRLMADRDDMVQKGLGWLLREWGKVRPGETVPLLMSIRERTSRLVLRTACERLPPASRARILAKPRAVAASRPTVARSRAPARHAGKRDLAGSSSR